MKARRIAITVASLIILVVAMFFGVNVALAANSDQDVAASCCCEVCNCDACSCASDCGPVCSCGTCGCCANHAASTSYNVS